MGKKERGSSLNARSSQAGSRPFEATKQQLSTWFRVKSEDVHMKPSQNGAKKPNRNGAPSCSARREFWTGAT